VSFRFVDLFAGIGGFHAVLHGLGGECVYAIEIDPKSAVVYEKNWGRNPIGDITQDVNDSDMKVPPHDVLVAGFPCQPFSKSGLQGGMDETRGTLFWNILKIVQERRPAMVFLENVRNISGPRHIHEWHVIIETLRAQGYTVCDEPTIFSPHLLPPELGGRPQFRERVFIVAVRDDDHSKNLLLFNRPVVANSPLEGWDPNSWSLEKNYKK
jgi:DNA (cytosine-5)-methyltransferase 1